MRAAIIGLAVLVALQAAVAYAQEPGTATTTATTVVIGEQFTIEVAVRAEPGDTVEVDRVAASWGTVEVVDVQVDSAEPSAGVQRFVVTVATFATGPVAFQPAVLITNGGIVEQRTLPEVLVAVQPTLADGAPLEVSPVAPPRAAGGDQSPLLVPAIAGGAAVVVLVAGGVLYWAFRRWRRARPVPATLPPSTPAPVDGFAAAESLIDSDYIGAYRLLATAFRTAVGHQFGLPAPALTSTEIEGRMTEAGVDPWLGRLSREVLMACDAVVYGGYRPATERRHADLAMARRVVEAGEGAA